MASDKGAGIIWRLLCDSSLRAFPALSVAFRKFYSPSYDVYLQLTLYNSRELLVQGLSSAGHYIRVSNVKRIANRSRTEAE